LPLNIGIFGYGYWGPNLVRNFASMNDVSVKYVCDASPKSIAKLAARHNNIKGISDPDIVFGDDAVDAVVIALPAALHADYAKRAVAAGKHVFIEKPLTLSVADAEELAAFSEKTDRVMMVGHLLLYHPAVLMLKNLVDSGDLGDIYYIYSQRLNFGIVRTDENALWSLAPHDISVINFLLGEPPSVVSAAGQSYISSGIEDTVFANLKFSDRKMAHLHVSWLDPHRYRRFTIVGSKKMAVFEDAEPKEKIKIIDKGVEKRSYESYSELLSLRFGDIRIPYVDATEPLKLECRHFADCIAKGEKPRSDMKSGLEVVKVLDAAQRSLESGGAEVKLG